MQDFLYKIVKNPKFYWLSRTAEYTEGVFRQFFQSGLSLRESRLIFERESSFGDHMNAYKEDVLGTYVRGRKGVFDRTIGGAGVLVNLGLKGPDQVFKAVIGQPYNPVYGIAGHTITDTKSFMRNLFRLKPLGALSDASSLVFSDIPMDAWNLVTGSGLSHGTRSTRASIGKTLAALPGPQPRSHIPADKTLAI